MIKMVAGLLIILGLLYMGSALLRRWQFGGSNSRQGIISIKESRPLGAKRMLCLVEVRGREVLLGVTPDRIEPLCHLEVTEENHETSSFDAELKHRHSQ
ncbi:FliO/MopB family protein [Desulfohalobium retbaense]|nr:flagellar biosynthetic protein FliO [Desulfohalobium retbaense]